MKKPVIGYALWLTLVAFLYFFENNAGTRVVLMCSALLPLLPWGRHMILAPAQSRPTAQRTHNVSVAVTAPHAQDEPGDVRDYRPADPVNLIHWKLSAKRDALLIREPAADMVQEQTRADKPTTHNDTHSRNWLPCLLAATALIAALLLCLIPQARRGALALLNRLFDASERVNAYAYNRFPVPEGQSVTAAAALLCVGCGALCGCVAASGSRALGLAFMACIVIWQVYFGLALPGWAQVPLFAAFALWMLARPWRQRDAARLAALIAAASLVVFTVLPGVHAPTEAASERARDWLSHMASHITGTVAEAPDGEIEARHAHTQSLVTGNQESQPDREYRPVTMAQEQISMPHFVNYLRIVLLLLLVVAVVVVPFLPFALLNARRKKAMAMRQAFDGPDVSQAVCAIFQHVITWLDGTGHGVGNLPYVQWPDHMTNDVPPHIQAQFIRCAALFEEAAYSCHPLPEACRQTALTLLSDTEQWLMPRLSWRQRLRLKYRECLYP